MIARGLTNPEIAAKLFLSNHTIKTHLNRIFAKTGSRDRAAPSATRTAGESPNDSSPIRKAPPLGTRDAIGEDTGRSGSALVGLRMPVNSSALMLAMAHGKDET